MSMLIKLADGEAGLKSVFVRGADEAEHIAKIYERTADGDALLYQSLLLLMDGLTYAQEANGWTHTTGYAQLYTGDYGACITTDPTKYTSSWGGYNLLNTINWANFSTATFTYSKGGGIDWSYFSIGSATTGIGVSGNRGNLASGTNVSRTVDVSQIMVTGTPVTMFASSPNIEYDWVNTKGTLTVHSILLE